MPNTPAPTRFHALIEDAREQRGDWLAALDMEADAHADLVEAVHLALDVMDHHHGCASPSRSHYADCTCPLAALRAALAHLEGPEHA